MLFIVYVYNYSNFIHKIMLWTVQDKNYKHFGYVILFILIAITEKVENWYSSFLQMLLSSIAIWRVNYRHDICKQCLSLTADAPLFIQFWIGIWTQHWTLSHTKSVAAIFFFVVAYINCQKWRKNKNVFKECVMRDACSLLIFLK